MVFGMNSSWIVFVLILSIVLNALGGKEEKCKQETYPNQYPRLEKVNGEDVCFKNKYDHLQKTNGTEEGKNCSDWMQCRKSAEDNKFMRCMASNEETWLDSKGKCVLANNATDIERRDLGKFTYRCFRTEPKGPCWFNGKKNNCCSNICEQNIPKGYGVYYCRAKSQKT